MLVTLNVVIGLIFVLLMFSLLASTVMEVIAALFSLRARHLDYTLNNMLGEKSADFVRHPLFKQLSYATNRRARISAYHLPSYISKETFTSILADLLNADSKEALAKHIDSLDEGDLKRMMQFLFRQANGNPAAFKAELGRWFDEVMDRAKDWYKRYLTWWLFAVGLALAVIFNADTIQIYQNISSSATTQDFLVAMASNFEARTDSVTGPDLNLTLEESVARMDSMLQRIEHIRSPLGLGWAPSDTGRTLPWWLVKLAGLLLTGIAVTMGAPFWFDMLKKLLSLRGSRSTETTTPPPPPDRPAPEAAPATETATTAKTETREGEPAAPPAGKSKPVG
ncbi:MAG: hypothetical protein KDD10_30075 [Phaeodactylibacter sp.]|nr:hypothetical protein [Phaeodactylibacter sp.]MCB9292669.1 hypothetical protein [Lewinellaceae bacterium]